MSTWQAYIDDIAFSYRKQQQTAEKAFQQLEGADDFFRKPGEHSNSVAIILKHVGCNLLSRWTDVLTTDGDKPWRNRDAEFVIELGDTRATLVAQWEKGWTALFQSLQEMQESDWLKKVTIRGEEHTVLQAIHRSLTHTTYHVGQIVYVCRLLKTDDWKWITIPPGKSKDWAAEAKPYLK